MGISATISGSGKIFLFLSPSQAQPFAGSPTALLSECSILLPYSPSSLSWAVPLPHVHHSILPHNRTLLSCLLGQSDRASPLGALCDPPGPFRHASVAQPGNLSGASDAACLISPIPQFLLSLHILPLHPASCLLPVLPSLLLFHVSSPASSVKFSVLKLLVHLPHVSCPLLFVKVRKDSFCC